MMKMMTMVMMMMVMTVLVVGCMFENSSRQEPRSPGNRLLVSRHLHSIGAFFGPTGGNCFIKTKTG